MWEEAYYSNRSNIKKTEYNLMREKIDINAKIEYNKISQEIFPYVVADERKINLQNIIMLKVFLN